MRTLLAIVGFLAVLAVTLPVLAASLGQEFEHIQIYADERIADLLGTTDKAEKKEIKALLKCRQYATVFMLDWSLDKKVIKNAVKSMKALEKSRTPYQQLHDEALDVRDSARDHLGAILQWIQDHVHHAPAKVAGKVSKLVGKASGIEPTVDTLYLARTYGKAFKIQAKALVTAEAAATLIDPHLP